jgi:hypothetical protein
MTQSNEDLAAHLELVEQNITLTLQQIDHNFAACHNTVATKLLPRVDRFGDISSSIWEGSQVGYAKRYGNEMAEMMVMCL